MTKSFENKINKVVQSIEPSPEFTKKLWREIQATPQQATFPKRTRTWRWVPATIILAFAIVLAILSPEEVLASLRGLFDFLPGVGLIQDDESTLYLAEPVTLEQDGAILTIEQVVSDLNKTTVVYHIDNLPGDSEDGPTSCFYSNNRLLLPDGKNLLPIGGSAAGNEAHIEFMPLPEGVTQLTLLAGMNSEEETHSCPKEWRVDFSLGTEKPEGMELLPVVEYTTEAPAAESGAEEPDSEEPVESANNEFKSVVDRAVIMQDGYILYGHTDFNNDHWTNASIDLQTLTAQDAEGKQIPLEQVDEGITDNEFIIKVATKDFAAPLTLHVEKLRTLSMEKTPAFSFDAGSDPQIGQSWEINQEIELSGINITIQSIEVIQESADTVQGEPQKGYAVKIQSNLSDYFNGFIACEGEQELPDIWGQTMPVDDTTMLLETFYRGSLPAGQVTCSFMDTHYLLAVDEEIEWQPPERAE